MSKQPEIEAIGDKGTEVKHLSFELSGTERQSTTTSHTSVCEREESNK